ncbi:hypothetical protein Taro_044624 [Colocasia esculenta]|uniref:Uncharacterized protein n=1 Tax=Colocasia esculenta TaxID=4460 RepID=A0A843WV17_COLES|nr:hypothetical protein [Colocasia esculenta]
MVGSVASSSARSHGVDRFYNPPALRRQLQLLQQQQQQHQKQQERQQGQQPQAQLQRPAKLKTKVAAAAAQAQIDVREVESRIDSDDSSSRPSVSASPSPPPRPPPPAGNLDRFLESTTPVVSAQYFPKFSRELGVQASTRCWRNGETMKFHPYFSLGDLWESFREWSAYGAGVPLTLNGGDSVIQYYVPYLSGIQLYVYSSGHRLRCR